jgi:DMSO/TMAO reductase YedYZ molybdopterin-dependent catalytic subunit
MTHVKWLGAIEALTVPFDGYQHSAYRYRQSPDDPGEPVTLMRVRSLLLPPGIPDFLTRTRVVGAGPVDLQGRAWSGHAPITRVEVSADGGASWDEAEVSSPPGHSAWQAWRYRWDATRPGTYELCCRAHDAAGNVQPEDQFWTAGGMGNNAIHRVRVVVRRTGG